MHWKDHRGNLIPVHIKALNTVARRMAASVSQGSQNEKAYSSTSSRSEVQKALLVKRPEADKAKTGMTPPQKQPRTEAQNQP